MLAALATRRIALSDLSATERLAAAVAALSRPGDAILLDGPLGAGKTAFARAFLRAASADAALEVPSPTFTLVQSYATQRGTVHHFDLWRLDGPAALEELGWDEARDDIVLVEWPDRLGALRPADALIVALQPITVAARLPAHSATTPQASAPLASAAAARPPAASATPASATPVSPAISAPASAPAADAAEAAGYAPARGPGDDMRHATLSGWPDRIGRLA